MLHINNTAGRKTKTMTTGGTQISVHHPGEERKHSWHFNTFLHLSPSSGWTFFLWMKPNLIHLYHFFISVPTLPPPSLQTLLSPALSHRIMGTLSQVCLQWGARPLSWRHFVSEYETSRLRWDVFPAGLHQEENSVPCLGLWRGLKTPAATDHRADHQPSDPSCGKARLMLKTS